MHREYWVIPINLRQNASVATLGQHVLPIDRHSQCMFACDPWVTTADFLMLVSPRLDNLLVAVSRDGYNARAIK